jgi:hypothetical protein
LSGLPRGAEAWLVTARAVEPGLGENA